MAAITAQRRNRLAVLAAVLGLLLAAFTARPGSEPATGAPPHAAITAGIAHQLAVVTSLPPTARASQFLAPDSALPLAVLAILALGLALAAVARGRDLVASVHPGLPARRAPPRQG